VEEEELIFGDPRVLFKAPIPGFDSLHDVTGDGRRLLILTGEPYSPTSATIPLDGFAKPANESTGPGWCRSRDSNSDPLTRRGF
jgi:hypothetical protein